MFIQIQNDKRNAGENLFFFLKLVLDNKNIYIANHRLYSFIINTPLKIHWIYLKSLTDCLSNAIVDQL